MAKATLPKHIGFIPDGNRRWALNRGLQRHDGYSWGISPGLALFDACKQLGVEEVSVYGFTQDNTKRPFLQREAFRNACVDFALEISRRGAALLVVGNPYSDEFPQVLSPFLSRTGEGIKVNLLINYGWEWDLDGLRTGDLRSRDVSRVDLIVRWGGGRRLSGFLPVQSVYADFFVVDQYWPDFHLTQFEQALSWYRTQDKTLGG